MTPSSKADCQFFIKKVPERTKTIEKFKVIYEKKAFNVSTNKHDDAKINSHIVDLISEQVKKNDPNQQLVKTLEMSGDFVNIFTNEPCTQGIEF